MTFRSIRVSRGVALTTVTAFVLGVSVMLSGPAGAGSTALWDGFESGTTTAWSATSHISVAGSYAETGSYGARATSTSSQTGYLTWSSSRIAQGQRYGRIRGWVKVESCNAYQSVDTFTLQNAYGSHHFDFFRDSSTGKWKYDLFSANSATSTMTANIGQWFYVEALVDFGGVGGTTYTANVRINGLAQPTIRSTSQVGTTVKAAWFGTYNVGKTNTRDYDELGVDVGNSPFSFSR
jgi:hypothetical protein